MINYATYSPDDNKIRLYPASRLSPELYARVRETGFIWAPKQGIFVAPMWTPEREDLARELAPGGDIADDDQSLLTRAEDRADRFDGYRENRLRDYTNAHAAVSAIADHIPLGQPILVGHHSERRARKDAERIQNGMRRAVKMWDTAQYWTDRARGAILHAKYKERPQVRARRIKGIEADRRRQVRIVEHAEKLLMAWRSPTLTLETARRAFEQHNQPDPALTLDEIRSRMIARYEARIAHAQRWIAHYDHRLAYEKAMLADQGASDLIAPQPKRKSRAASLPLLNYRAPGGITVENRWRKGETIHRPQVDMTAAEYAGIHTDYKATCVSADGTHRVRSAMQNHALVSVFLTDSKVHPIPVPPVPPETPETPDPTPLSDPPRLLHEGAPVRPERAIVPPSPVAAMRASLAAGVQVVAVPQLFPTPPDVARRVVQLADVRPGQTVLEPSAGTGPLVRAVQDAFCGADCGRVVAVELSGGLVQRLEQLRNRTLDANSANFEIIGADFLEWNLASRIPGIPDRLFDRIVMNPPFKDGADIQHIQHARRMLKSGGRLVAICANGPRQQRALQGEAVIWEELPAGTFDGTNVRAAIVVLEGIYK